MRQVERFILLQLAADSAGSELASHVIPAHWRRYLAWSDLIAQGFHVSDDFNFLNCPVRPAPTCRVVWSGYPATIWRSVLLLGQVQSVLALHAVLNAILTPLSIYLD